MLLWELAGLLKWVGQGALPAPSQVLQQAWIDRADYPPHLWGTVRTASIGLVIGNAVPVALGLLFVAWRPAGRLMAGVNITLFAMPAIALVPILVIALDGDTPRVVLAALSVNYPTMVEWLLALGVSEVVLRGPLGVFEHLALADNAADNLARLGQALAQTLPYTVLGRAAGLVVAAVLAVAGTVWPTLGRSLLPLSLVSQSMPLVALTPLVPGAHGNAVPRGVRHRRRRDLHPHPHDRGRPAAQARLRDRVDTARSADAGHHPAAAGAAGDGSVVAAAGRLTAGQRVRPVFQTGVSGRLVSPPARQAPGGTR